MHSVTTKFRSELTVRLVWRCKAVAWWYKEWLSFHIPNPQISSFQDEIPHLNQLAFDTLCGQDCRRPEFVSMLDLHFI